jgi:hypothetical protein
VVVNGSSTKLLLLRPLLLLLFNLLSYCCCCGWGWCYRCWCSRRSSHGGRAGPLPYPSDHIMHASPTGEKIYRLRSRSCHTRFLGPFLGLPWRSDGPRRAGPSHTPHLTEIERVFNRLENPPPAFSYSPFSPF